LKGLVYSQM